MAVAAVIAAVDVAVDVAVVMSMVVRWVPSYHARTPRVDRREGEAVAELTPRCEVEGRVDDDGEEVVD